MMYSFKRHLLLPVLAIAVFAAMFIYYWPSDEPETDEHRGCVASAYQATRYSGSTLEANLKVCNEL